MSAKPTIFFVTDVETCKPKERGKFSGLVFDTAWQAIDRRGKVYFNQSFSVTDALELEYPYYWQKVGRYMQYCYDRNIKPVPFAKVRKTFNRQLVKMIREGHRVVFAAYNAPFDCEALSYTSQRLLGGPFLTTKGIGLLDIWDYWGESVPLNYTAQPTSSGKFLSTSAESAARFELQNPDFIEEHIGFSDVSIEVQILLKALARKKRLPIVTHPQDFAGAVYRKINRRLGIDGKSELRI